METEKTNGQETNLQQQQEASYVFADARNFAKDGRNSGRPRHQSQRASREVDASMGRAGIYRSLGGILGLLRGIVSKGLNYMDAHSERLEARLTESKRAKADFLEQAAALEKEIVRLLEQAEKLPEDPNEEEK